MSTVTVFIPFPCANSFFLCVFSCHFHVIYWQRLFLQGILLAYLWEDWNLHYFSHFWDIWTQGSVSPALLMAFSIFYCCFFFHDSGRWKWAVNSHHVENSCSWEAGCPLHFSPLLIQWPNITHFSSEIKNPKIMNVAL